MNQSSRFVPGSSTNRGCFCKSLMSHRILL